MKRCFMRAFWGINDNSNRILKRKQRVEGNIKTILTNKFNEPFITYVFGKENHKYLVDLGFKDVILIHDEPFKWDLIEYQYRHKLESILYAFKEDKYDEMVHLDWDCIPQKPLSTTFWEDLGKQEVFQANLVYYKRAKANWRASEPRKIPNGGFVYIRDNTVPEKLIKIWETMKGPSVEPPMAKLVDEMTDGWKGIETYWKLFEPKFCCLNTKSPYSKELEDSKDKCFIHYEGG